MRDKLEISQDPRAALRVFAGVVWAEGVVPVTSSSPLLDAEIARILAVGEGMVSPGVRDAVRAMLRYGTYKPSGRAKPASEFLWRAAGEGNFPRVSGPVDVNNAVSLASGLPGSIFDAELTGMRLHLRHGDPGESYVFNPSGQSIDLEDLLVVCRDVGGRWEPCGNPVKDAMATKVRDETTSILGVLYVPRELGRAIAERWTARYVELIEQCCAPRRTDMAVFGAD